MAKKTIKTTITFYRFNIEPERKDHRQARTSRLPDAATTEETSHSRPSESGIAYQAFRARLSKIHENRFMNGAQDPSKKTWSDDLRPDKDGQITYDVELQLEYLFTNQWNATVILKDGTRREDVRVFDWYEAIYPNRLLKYGHFLEITEEIRKLRASVRKCGYCDRSYADDGLCNRTYVEGKAFCVSCLSSTYLDEDSLHMLRLVPLSEHLPTRAPLTDKERDTLIATYVQAQVSSRASEEQREKVRSKCAKTTENAETERDGFLWLLDHGINIENVIFYTHTGRFCFGWRRAYGPMTKDRLLDVLCEFPFDYDIKEEKGSA